jgi:competence protein ComEA
MVQRILIGAGVLALAAFAIWHPAPRTSQAFVAAAVDAQPRRARPALSAGVIVVYVVGAVAHPGLYRLTGAARADDAVRRAGGLTSNADPAGVNLAQRLADGDQVLVPRIGEALRSPRSSGQARTSRGRSHRARRLPPAAAIDLNAADATSLAQIPGIGPTLAARIVAYRDLNGPFASADELLDVAGFTAGRLDRVAPYIVVR